MPGFPESEADSTCVPAVQNYISGYAARRPDVSVHVISFQYPFARGVYRWKGVTVHALAGRNRRNVARIATWARAVHVFRRLHQANRVEALHSFWLTECALVGQRLSRRYGVPHVVSLGGQDAREANPYRRWLRLDNLTLTAGSAFAADVFSRHTPAPVPQVVPLGLDVPNLAAIVPPDTRDIDVLGVGSLIPLKNYTAFLDIVAALTEDFPDLTARIVGEGPERRTLEDHLHRRHLKRNVQLPGQLRREIVFRDMQRSRVFLHTSHYEGQGYVFLEALYAGIPVVCFDVGYAGAGGLVHRCNDAAQMVTVVGNLLRSPRPLEPQAVLSVDDTVTAFENLYRALGGALQGWQGAAEKK